MKTNATLLVLSSFTILFFASCQRDLDDMNLPEQTSDRSYVESSAVSPYAVTLLSRVQSGANWVWTWKVQNTNPGNGSNGTAQGLSHWGFTPGICLNSSVFVSAGYSQNNVTWTNFTPSIGADPSTSSCIGNTPVFKFDFGTNGAAPSYFRLVINQDLLPGNVQGYYKSGKKTGCGTFQFVGISCIPGYGDPS